MKKILIILFIIIIIIGAIFLVNAYSKDSKQKRYTEIKEDINTELERWMYVIAPKCNEIHIWSWDIKLSCKDYEDEGYVDWDEAFTPKVWNFIFFINLHLKIYMI